MNSWAALFQYLQFNIRKQLLWLEKKVKKNFIHEDFSFILPLHWSVFLVNTRLHNLYLLKFFNLYERTFTVLKLLKFFEKNLTRQPFLPNAFETLFIRWWPFYIFISGGGFGVFTDRDQRSIFWVLNFENLYFFGLLNKSRILKCFILFRSSFIHQVFQ